MSETLPPGYSSAPKVCPKCCGAPGVYRSQTLRTWRVRLAEWIGGKPLERYFETQIEELMDGEYDDL